MADNGYNVWDDAEVIAASVSAAQAGVNQLNNAISSWKTSESNERLAKENREFQLAASKELWNMENEYNNPSSQMARLVDAGINPYVAASKVAESNSSSSMPTPSQTAPVNQAYTGFGQAFSDAANVLGQLANARNKTAESEFLERTLAARAKSEVVAAQQKEFDYELDKIFKSQERNSFLQESQSRIKKSLSDIELALSQKDYYQAEKLYTDLKSEHEKVLTQISEKERDNYDKLMQRTFDEIASRIYANYEQGRASRASAANQYALASLAVSQKEHQDIINRFESSNQKLQNAILGHQAKGALVDYAKNVLTAFDEVKGAYLRNSVMRAQVDLISKQANEVYARARKSGKEADWYELNQIVQIGATIIGSMKGSSAMPFTSSFVK